MSGAIPLAHSTLIHSQRFIHRALSSLALARGFTRHTVQRPKNDEHSILSFQPIEYRLYRQYGRWRRDNRATPAIWRYRRAATQRATHTTIASTRLISANAV